MYPPLSIHAPERPNVFGRMKNNCVDNFKCLSSVRVCVYVCVCWWHHMCTHHTRQERTKSYLVDPASSHMLVSKIKPCMSKFKQTNSETANGSLNQL